MHFDTGRANAVGAAGGTNGGTGAFLRGARLRFDDPALERAFLDEFYGAFLPQKRIALGVGAFLYASFGLLDPWALPDAEGLAWTIRYAVVCPIILGVFGLSFTRPFRRLSQELISAVVLTSGAGLIVMMAAAPPAAGDLYYAGLILIALFAWTFTRLRFVYALAASAALIAAYGVMATWVRPRPTVVLVNNFYFITAANIIGGVAAYQIERYTRTDFLQRRRLAEEEEKSRRLLLNVLPPSVADRLKQEPGLIADNFPEATILFADLVGFTKWSGRVSPQALVASLNQVFSAFDRLVEARGLEKIKTIGDCYMVAGGIPLARADHAEAVVDLAGEMLAEVVRFGARHGERLEIRIGINTGPVVAGVIGTKKFIYDLWGDAVNVASRMESHGVPGAVHCTQAVRDRLHRTHRFEPRGTIEIKGKGPMTTYLLAGRPATPASGADGRPAADAPAQDGPAGVEPGSFGEARV